MKGKEKLEVKKEVRQKANEREGKEENSRRKREEERGKEGSYEDKRQGVGGEGEGMRVGVFFLSGNGTSKGIILWRGFSSLENR